MQDSGSTFLINKFLSKKAACRRFLKDFSGVVAESALIEVKQLPFNGVAGYCPGRTLFKVKYLE